MKLTYQDVKVRLHWSESNDLEFKPDFKEKYWQNDRIFDTIVAMANNEGGNIIIGINEFTSKHTRRIIGTNLHQVPIQIPPCLYRHHKLTLYNISGCGYLIMTL